MLTRDIRAIQKYYMVLGSTFREKEGRAVFFRSRDGEHWQYAAQYRNPSFGRILECPDLFRLGDRYVFVGSAMYTEDAENGYEHQSVTALAEFDSRTCTMEISSEFQYVDYGMDLYAPQTNVDREGRRVLIGWMRMPEGRGDRRGAYLFQNPSGGGKIFFRRKGR